MGFAATSGRKLPGSEAEILSIQAGSSLPAIFQVSTKNSDFPSFGVEMLTALSPENQINIILRELDCAVSNFAGIAARLSGTRVAAALSGSNDFSTEDGQHYLDIARRMKRLQDDAGVPVDWRKVSQLQAILATKKQQERPIPFAVILSGSVLFKKMTNQQPEFTTSYSDCAAFTDPLLATAAAKILDGMGQTGLRVITITNQPRSEESLAKSLQEVGFNQGES